MSLQDLPIHLRLPLIELSIPALHRQSESQLLRLAALMNALLLVDNHIDIFEWVLKSLIITSLQTNKPKLKPSKTRFTINTTKSIKQVRGHLSILISALIHYFGQEDHQILLDTAHEKLAGVRLTLVPLKTLNMEILDRALEGIDQIHILEKPKVVKAALSIINLIENPKPEAFEFVKALGAVIDCPIPHLISRV